MAAPIAAVVAAKKNTLQKHWAVTFNAPVDLLHHVGFNELAPVVGAPYEITLVGPPQDVCKHQVAWYVGQLERAPTTGQLHIQMHVCFKAKVGFNGVKHFFDQSNFAGAHLEPVKDLSAHLAYVVKEDTRLAGPYRSPGAPKEGDAVQGKRTDLEAVVEAAKGGATVESLWQDHSLIMVKHFRGMERLVQQIGTAPARPTMMTICFYGLPRMGKSTVMYELAKELFPESTAFPKPIGKWFCGYHGQEVICLDDFDSKGQACREIKNICDKTPCIVETKGGQVHLRNKLVIVTCNETPLTWYPNEAVINRNAVLERMLFFRIDERIVGNAGMEGFGLNDAGKGVLQAVRTAIAAEANEGEGASGARGERALLAQADRYVPYAQQIMRVEPPRVAVDQGPVMIIESSDDEEEQRGTKRRRT